MSAFTRALEESGLSHTEAIVYEAGLKEGETDISRLSMVLNLNRATAYHAVHELAQRGLLSKRIENGRLVISMIKEDVAETLFNYEEEKMKERKLTLHQFFKNIPSPRRKSKEPDAEYFTGFDGIRMALERAFRAKSRRWDIIAPRHNFFSEVDEQYASYYLAERKKRGIVSRTLWEKTAASGRLRGNLIKERQPRYLPDSCSGTFNSVIILFDGQVLLISSTKEMQAMLVNSPDLYSIFKMQFNILWDISKPVTESKAK